MASQYQPLHNENDKGSGVMGETSDEDGLELPEVQSRIHILDDAPDSGHNGLRKKATIARPRSTSPKQAPRAETFVESHDYEPDESEVWRSHQALRSLSDRGAWWTSSKKRVARSWTMTLVIGVLTGLTATFVSSSTQALSTLKFDTVLDVMDRGKGPGISSLCVLMAFNCFYVAVASLMVFIEPLSAGSGIPEMKCYLNGVNIPRVVDIKTLVCKVLGVSFSVAGGLPAGKEGPMIHSGSVIAATVSQGSNGMGGSCAYSQDFRNDREKRDFVASGAAAGVAAAFGAPIGGVLFSLEEGASFWSTRLTWSAFFCAMSAVFTIYTVNSAENKWGQQELATMFSFGEFNEIQHGHVSFSVWELWLFGIVGCMGGMIGACFNHYNEKLAIWRQQHVKTRRRKFMEALCVAALMSIVCFTMPLLWGQCTPKPVHMQDWTSQERILVSQLVSFNCDAETEYNEVASLFFTDADTAIRQLFHMRESRTGNLRSSTFSSGALFMFFMPYATMACLTYGVAVPSGLFVPSLLSGAAFGRLCGHLLHKISDATGSGPNFADSGTYALVGAAAALGGMARMTISLTVIILEATGDMQYVLPLMLTLMAARWVGNSFNEGLYDIHIRLRNLPYLDDELNAQDDMTASQVMSRDVKCFRPFEKVGFVYDVLMSTDHQCFPVVETAQNSVVLGTIMRKCLCVLLQRKAFGAQQFTPAHTPLKTRRKSRNANISGSIHTHNCSSSTNSVNGSKENSRTGTPLLGPTVEQQAKWRQRKLSLMPLPWDWLEGLYPHYPSIQDVNISPEERGLWLDLRPYVNTAPYVIHESASIARTYRLFRTLGLRHLCVVNHHSQVVGIITRKDLGSANLNTSRVRPRTRMWSSTRADSVINGYDTGQQQQTDV